MYHTPQLHVTKLQDNHVSQADELQLRAQKGQLAICLAVFVEWSSPLESVHESIKKEGDYWQTHPPICQRWFSSAVCICLTEVLCWGITKKPAQSTVSLTTPIRLWGRSCSALWLLLSASCSPSVVKVLRSPQLSRYSNLGCSLKGNTGTLNDMASWAGAITFKKKKKSLNQFCFQALPLK